MNIKSCGYAENLHKGCLNEPQILALYEALRTLVNNIPVPEIELARSVWGNTNVACVLDARAKAVEVITEMEGYDDQE
jgi:hypothetical protein